MPQFLAASVAVIGYVHICRSLIWQADVLSLMNKHISFSRKQKNVCAGISFTFLLVMKNYDNNNNNNINDINNNNNNNR